MSDIEIVTDRAAFRETAAGAPTDARVPVEVRVTVSDPFRAYRRARDRDGDGFYLETTGGQSGWGYFGLDPVERLQVGPTATARDSDESPSVRAIESLLDRETLVRGDCQVPYPCGAVGWLSYDVARELEDLPASAEPTGLPRLQLGTYDTVAAWEEPFHDGGTLHVTACPVVKTDAEAAYETGLGRAQDLAAAALEGTPTVGSDPTASQQVTFESEAGETAFADRVRTVKEYIREGDTFQANVSHRLVAPATVHPVDIFAALRRVNPAPYSGLLEFPGVDLVSASPELLLAVEGDRLLTEPIAGTRPRGETSAADEALEADLRSDEKEAAEHAMLVDLERNDLGKVSEYGSVDVTEYRRVDRYSEVMHLVSLVEGQRRAEVSVADAVAAVFPGGTITGAPKPRTMEIIDEVEATRRGPYTGSIGLFGFDDRATLNIVIRTLVRQEGEYRLRVGSGVVHDSVPASEYAETLDKARALVTAVDEALGERGSLAVERGTDAMGGVR
ncbi:MAG: anthranilate synthase component I family protein [Haloarculaceae archaeon]